MNRIEEMPLAMRSINPGKDKILGSLKYVLALDELYYRIDHFPDFNVNSKIPPTPKGTGYTEIAFDKRSYKPIYDLKELFTP